MLLPLFLSFDRQVRRGDGEKCRGERENPSRIGKRQQLLEALLNSDKIRFGNIPHFELGKRGSIGMHLSAKKEKKCASSNLFKNGGKKRKNREKD